MPAAEVEELLPAAQLLQRQGEGPTDYEAAKAAFLSGLTDFLAAAQLQAGGSAGGGGGGAEGGPQGAGGAAAAFRSLIERFEQGSASSAAAAASAAEVRARRGRPSRLTAEQQQRCAAPGPPRCRRPCALPSRLPQLAAGAPSALPALQELRGSWSGGVQAYGGAGGSTAVDFNLKGASWRWGEWTLDQVARPAFAARLCCPIRPGAARVHSRPAGLTPAHARRPAAHRPPAAGGRGLGPQRGGRVSG